MPQGRIELTPAQQLEQLCQARDYYVSLVESIQKKVAAGNPITERDERHAKKARRFAAAYERSVEIQRALMDRGQA